MGLSVVTYALAKKYTDETVIGLGGLKGAPCKVKSVVKTDGRSVITLEWKSDTGITQETEIYVNDGVSIWIPGRNYAVNDIVINDNTLYICAVANSDTSFDDNKWAVMVGDGAGYFYIVNTIAERPASLSSSDRKIYYCIDTGTFYLWDGTQWSVISGTGTNNYEDLQNLPKINGITLSGDQSGSDLKLLDENAHLDNDQLNTLLALI